MVSGDLESGEEVVRQPGGARSGDRLPDRTWVVRIPAGGRGWGETSALAVGARWGVGRGAVNRFRCFVWGFDNEGGGGV